MIRKIVAILTTLSCVACSTNSGHDTEQRLYVTINPLRMLVEELTCGDFDVAVLVPRGASPETFEPTARQMRELNDAELVFSTGLIDFESGLVANIDDRSKVIELHHGIEIASGCCSHKHHHHGHAHGIDPHIWTSPRALSVMVETMSRAIANRYPDSTKYRAAAEELLSRIAALDSRCEERITAAGIRAMMIYHPAYTYYARDYGIEQIAIEQEGKEPTPRQLTALVERAQRDGIDVIFHQPQYNADKLRTIANESGARIEMCDPLADDILAEIELLTAKICGDDE